MHEIVWLQYFSCSLKCRFSENHILPLVSSLGLSSQLWAALLRPLPGSPLRGSWSSLAQPRDGWGRPGGHRRPPLWVEQKEGAEPNAGHAAVPTALRGLKITMFTHFQSWVSAALSGGLETSLCPRPHHTPSPGLARTRALGLFLWAAVGGGGEESCPRCGPRRRLLTAGRQLLLPEITDAGQQEQQWRWPDPEPRGTQPAPPKALGATVPRGSLGAAAGPPYVSNPGQATSPL